MTVEDNPAEALAITGDSGRFGFANIPPGRYKLRARCDGYQQAWYGAPTPRYAAGVITLHPGERRQDFNLRLTMLGSISGVVLDQDGDPVDGANVSLVSRSFRRGKRSFGQHGSASTNDRGEYRISNVTPGSYLVMANSRGRQALRIQPESAASTQPIEQPRQLQYGIQYFPSAERPTEASLITVAAGKEIAGIDFHLTAQAMITLRGNVIPPPELPADAFIQIMARLDLTDDTQFGFGSGAGPPNYEFTFAGFMPGEYLLAASVTAGGHPYRGVQRVVISAGAENHATIKLDPGIDLAGTVKVEGQKMDAATQVSLSPGDAIPFQSNAPQAQVKPDGTFVISDVVPGVWDIGVHPLPDGGYIKSMRLGRQDVLTEDMVIGPDTKDKLDIVVSTQGGVLEGDVKTEPGESTAPAHVLAAPDGQYSHVMSFYGFATSDEKGHFTLKHLTPGRYRIYAFDALDYCDWCDPDFLKPFADLSQVRASRRRCKSAGRNPPHSQYGQTAMKGLILLGFAASLAAQTVSVQFSQDPSPSRGPVTFPTGNGSIEGTVINEVTGAPVRQAQVTISANAPPAVTDATGRFVFRNLAPATYFLQAMHPLFPRPERRMAMRPFSVTLGQDEQKRDVVIPLTPGATISGTMVDEDRKPMPGCNVQALTFQLGQPDRRLNGFRGASTDALGQYRLYGLPSGRYYLMAQCYHTLPAPHPLMRIGPDTDLPQYRYLPEFYPGIPNASGAGRLAVAAGADLQSCRFSNASDCHRYGSRALRRRSAGASSQPASTLGFARPNHE